MLLQDVNGNVPLDYAPDGTETCCILRKYLQEKGKDGVRRKPHISQSQVKHLCGKVCSRMEKKISRDGRAYAEKNNNKT